MSDRCLWASSGHRLYVLVVVKQALKAKMLCGYTKEKTETCVQRFFGRGVPSFPLYAWCVQFYFFANLAATVSESIMD